MAVWTITDDTEKMLGDIPPIIIPKDGKLSEAQITILSDTLRQLITKVNGLISHGTGLSGHRGNIDEQHIDFITPSVADTEFAVPHGLGRLPFSVEVVRKDRAVDVYDSSPGSWDESTIYLKATVASALIKLRLQ